MKRLKKKNSHRRQQPSHCLLHPTSAPISITDFFTEHLISCPPEYDEAEDAVSLQRAEETLQLDLGLGASDLCALREDCALQTLNCEDEPVMLDSQLAIRVPETFGLETARRLNAAFDADTIHRMSVRDKRLRRVPTDLSYLNAREQGSVELSGNSYLKDVLLTVMVMKPMRQLKSRGSKARIGQRLEVLGRQSLSDLRDRITCSLDDAILGDCSDCLDNLPSVRAKSVYPSSYFYIEGTFYSDLRKSEQRDLSVPVRQWISEDAERTALWGEPAHAKMDEVQFRDLTIRLGLPYLFLHLGDCEHLIVFSDLRMLGPHDCQDPHKFPIQTGYQLDRARLCKICQRGQIRWGAQGSELLPEDPTFLCEPCLRLFLYDEEGKKKDPNLHVHSIAPFVHVL